MRGAAAQVRIKAHETREVAVLKQIDPRERPGSPASPSYSCYSTHADLAAAGPIISVS